jgi:hypothetical protein
MITGLSAVIYFFYSPKSEEKEAPQPQQVTVNLRPLETAIQEIPGKVLQSIQSSANTHKGALGELVGYTKLHSMYDRIVPLGNIVDFMCIKFPEGDDPGRVDFVDVKTGAGSRLSKDQRQLQKIIQDRHINFIKLKVQTTHNEDKS